MANTSLAVIDAVPAVVVEPVQKIGDLETAAQEFNSQISQGQKSLAAAYFKLGEALAQLRPLYQHGTWETHLTRLGIEQTRARRAMWFVATYQTLAKAEKVESPAKAYADRPRKQSQRKKRAAGNRVHQSGQTRGRAIAAQPENVSEEEFLVFTSFVKACNGLGRAMQIFDSCCSMYKEVAVNE